MNALEIGNFINQLLQFAPVAAPSAPRSALPPPRPEGGGAYHYGTRNQLMQMAEGGDLGGKFDPATVNRAYHNAAIIWNAAAPLFPSQRMPNLDLTGITGDRAIPPNAYAAAWGPGNPNIPWKAAPDASWVGLSGAAIRDLSQLTPRRGTVPVPWGSVLGAPTLLHEWAHTFQSPQTYALGNPFIEGGAEAFSRSALGYLNQQLGLPPGMNSEQRAYPDWTRFAQKRGNRWVMKGQFGSPYPPFLPF